MAGEKVHLTKEKETLLITVYRKAPENRLPQSLLKNHFADEAVSLTSSVPWRSPGHAKRLTQSSRGRRD